MTNATFNEVFGDLIAEKAPAYQFGVYRKDARDFSEACYKQLVRSVIETLQLGDHPENDEYFDPLGCTLYTSKDGEAILDITVCTGGPHIEARYESQRDSLTITGLWAGDVFEVRQGHSDESPLKIWASEYCENMA